MAVHKHEVRYEIKKREGATDYTLMVTFWEGQAPYHWMLGQHMTLGECLKAIPVADEMHYAVISALKHKEDG